MATTYRAILSAIKSAIEGVTTSDELNLNATNVIIAADDTDITAIKGMTLVMVIPEARPIGEVGKYSGGLHQVTTNLTVRSCRRVNVDQAGEDETRLTSATLGVLFLEDEILKVLIRNRLTDTLDEALELTAHSRPRTRPGGWVTVNESYRAMYSQTITALKAS